MRSVTSLARISSFRPAIGAALLGLTCALAAGCGDSEPPPQPRQPEPAGWAEWIERDFPFFSSVLDARQAGGSFPADNLTPRGLILNLGGGHWVGFDLDLLRVAAIWRGNGVTPKALAPGSYDAPDRKTPLGQSPAPEPDGKVWLANGIYPGWQNGARLSLDDPRPPAPSAEEVGRGPLPARIGRFTAVRLVGSGAVLEYSAGGAEVRDWFRISEDAAVERHFEMGPSAKPLWLALGFTPADVTVSLSDGNEDGAVLERLSVPYPSGHPENGADAPAPLWAVRIPPHRTPIRFAIAVPERGASRPPVTRAIPTDHPSAHWPQEVSTKTTMSTAKSAYVVDDIALPLDNPWRRDVRLSDIQFLRDGTGAGVTLDGDVWLVRGLHEPQGVVRWRRFTSGLHEPLTLAIRDNEVHVFDRNGIWRLRDTNGDGEADVHELFSNAFAQTADMREFPNTLRLGPGGEFVIAKGGQEATTLGKHNGSVLRISADGRRATRLGYGLRQPNIGVNVRTGLVTASDQQGNYVPATPLHVVQGDQFYGFLSSKRPREVYPAPIADPLTWIPHGANASGMSQIWLFGARMGPLNDSLLHIGFNRPELFRVLLNGRGRNLQAAVVSITRAFDFPPLNGSVNPADGQVYVAGFFIRAWGTTATRLAGLARLRYTGAVSTLPSELAPMDKGVLLRFDVPLEPSAATATNRYTVMSWHYKRTYKYGSPQFKGDGRPGMDRLTPSAVYLSQDRRSVFIAVPGMKSVMQMHVGWSLATADGTEFTENAYFTPYELTRFDPRAEGFGDIAIDLSPNTATVTTSTQASAERGRAIVQRAGCIACHAIDRSSAVRVGPALHGLFGTRRTFANGIGAVVANESYVRESIVEPSAKIAPGLERAEAGMPSYAGVLTPEEIESIILFIKTLK